LELRGRCRFVVLYRQAEPGHRAAGAQAEEGLKETSEKYRALVEAATEGTLMVLDGKCAYSNKTMLDMLGYEDGELAPMDAESLLAPSEGVRGRPRRREALRTLLDGGAVSHQFEARLRRKDGSFAEVLLAATRIPSPGKMGYPDRQRPGPAQGNGSCAGSMPANTSRWQGNPPGRVPKHVGTQIPDDRGQSRRPAIFAIARARTSPVRLARAHRGRA
jgi:PAS domain S-box-containing protein